MASKKTEEKKQPTLNIKGMKVEKVRRLSENVICFSLLGNGLGLYNMKVIDGSKGAFVAAPQEKGKDGKYYNMFAVYLADEDEQKIIKAVKDKLPAEDDDDDIDL